MSIPLFSLLLFLLGSSHPDLVQVPFDELVSMAMPSVIAGEPAAGSYDGRPVCRPGDVTRFYELRRKMPVWVRDGGLTAAGDELLVMLKRSRLEGLDPEDYRVSEVQERLNDYSRLAGVERRDLVLSAARLEHLLTTSFLRYARHKAIGRANSERLDPDWPKASQPSGFIEALVNNLETGGPRIAVKAVEAQHPMYRRLLNALQEYNRIAAGGGWPRIPGGPELVPGSTGARVTLLRRRLMGTGAGGDAGLFDVPLQAAVKAFQSRHGLMATGRVDRSTLAELNVTAEQRIRQLELNLERTRWFPSDFGSRYIVVNIPEAMLRVVEHDSVVLATRAVVGKANRQTPVLVDTMTSLVLNPSWNLPPTIFAEDVLPKLTSNADYLRDEKIKVFARWGKTAREVDPDSIRWDRVNGKSTPLHLRMDPGGRNPLGEVKFLFPNAEDVYIHDSPQTNLYRKEKRLFSSGCIRIERARDLAYYLLSDSRRWDTERVAATLASGEEVWITLKSPVPVYLVYLTAWVGDDGVLHFRPDYYGRDTMLASLLEEEV